MTVGPISMRYVMYLLARRARNSVHRRLEVLDCRAANVKQDTMALSHELAESVWHAQQENILMEMGTLSASSVLEAKIRTVLDQLNA